MGSKKELVSFVDSFIKAKKASWDHDDWLVLVENVKKKGHDISDSKLGNLLEQRREIFYAKKYETRIISKSKLVNLCRRFVKKHKAHYSHDQWLKFLDGLSKHGYFNKDEVVSLLEIEKSKFQNRKPTKAPVKKKQPVVKKDKPKVKETKVITKEHKSDPSVKSKLILRESQLEQMKVRLESMKQKYTQKQEQLNQVNIQYITLKKELERISSS